MTSDTRLRELLRGAAWIPEDVRRADGYERVDEAVLAPGATLLVVSPVGGPAHGRRLLVPVSGDGSGRLGEAQGTTAFDRACVRLVAAGGRLPTVRGGHLEFRGRGTPVDSVEPLPFEQGWSSNSLSLIDIDGLPHLHKTYRTLGADVREPELLRLMNDSGRTPRWFGDYSYLPPGGEERLPLGVIYAYAPGSGIDAPLRENLRSLWPKLLPGTEGEPLPGTGPKESVEDLVHRHLAPLADPLHTAGRFLGAFHEDLRLRLGGGTAPPDYPVRRALRAAEERTAALAERARTEPRLPSPTLAGAFRSITSEIERLREAFDTSDTRWSAGPCHGDLHLSHLLWDPPRLIDISTPGTGPDDPGWAEQSPLEDVVALQRALEYFSADEAAFESARILGVDSTETMLGALDGAPGLPPEQRSVLLLVFEAADTWRRRVVELLLSPVLPEFPDLPGIPGLPEASGPAGPPVLSDAPLRRLLYLRRLLHELDYNFAHARPYHAAIDLRHALALGPVGKTPPSHHEVLT
ncbi:phosphotransferase [Streptomyces sp. NPDC017254]|uniref:phosphotransferase n=1 Tax=unclassified Streptomyces TaxID=2593676 RepID=UPI0037BDA42C